MPTCPYCHQTWQGTHHCAGVWQRKKPTSPVEQRRFDAAEADGWYLQAPKGVGRRRRSGFGPPVLHPCPVCYRPGLEHGLCAACTAKRGA